MEKLNLYIESLIFTTEKPISRSSIKEVLEAKFEAKITIEEINESISQLEEKYRSDDFSFSIVEINESFQFLTKGAYVDIIGKSLQINSRKKLSKSALETLAIIAYKQPVIKSEIEQIRGVASVYSLQKLLEKELIEINGRGDGPGRPLLYGTSEKFMNYFGLKSIKDLPKIKEFDMAETQIGELAPIEESE